MAKYYVQRTGDFYMPDQSVLFTAYAGGDCGARLDGTNNPAMQYEHNVGPLCAGDYAIGAPATHGRLGPGTMALTPNPANNMGNPPRGDFFIHGIQVGQTMAQRASSDGCICISPESIRIQAYTESGDNDLKVVSEETDLPWNQTTT